MKNEMGLKEKLDLAIKALEYYANERNWRVSGEEDGWAYFELFFPDWQNLEKRFQNEDLEAGRGSYFVCGSRAREALETIKENGGLNEKGA